MSAPPKRAEGRPAAGPLPILSHYRKVRAATAALASPLSPEDCQLQSMPDTSPTKWHLAHTTWFFETFVLAPHLPGYRVFHPSFAVLFNSYYVRVGERHARPERGVLSRPSLDEVHAYRRHVDSAVQRLGEEVPEHEWRDLLELGLHHEQQHQELIVMDIQHAFSRNPLEPAYDEAAKPDCLAGPARWLPVPGGLYEIGHDRTGFAFDNEGPRHKVWLEPFVIADRLVTNGQFLKFIRDGGYQRPEFWLSDGWDAVAEQGWVAPLYWGRTGEEWTRFSLAGRCQLDLAEPVLHVSYYEADAFARWAGYRLPTEAEWEIAAGLCDLHQLDSLAWQWTASAYSPYPGFVARDDAIGEYNGKFMVNQFVLRGGSLATPEGHARRTYRNFFSPAARWPFTGIRLVER
jgi:ergothioneine biosynthesis protein EgtB